MDRSPLNNPDPHRPMPTRSPSGFPDGFPVRVPRFAGFARFDSALEKGVIILLVFTPLAFGSVHEWAFSIMEIAAFALFGVWLIKIVFEGKIEFRAAPLGIFFILFTLLIIFQITPLPARLVNVISPNTSLIYENFSTNGAAWQTISVYPYLTKSELFKFLSYGAIFFVIINNVKTKEAIRRIALTIIFVGAFMAVFAVLQKLTWNGKLFWIYPIKENVTSDMTHIWGPYINHNHFAGYMEMAIPLGLGFIFYKLSGFKTIPGASLKRNIVRFSEGRGFLTISILAVAVIIMAGAIFMSFSRGGIVGFTISTVLFLAMAFTRKSLKKKSALISIALLSLLSAAVIISWGGLEGRFSEIGEENRIARFEVWQDSIGMVKDFPIVGTGLGSFRSIYPQYQTHGPMMFFSHAESDYIEILTDAGFVGFILFMGMVFVFFYGVIKRWFQRRNAFAICMGLGGLASVVAMAVHGAGDFNMRIPANAFLLAVIAAIAYAAVHNVKRSDENI